MTGQVLFKAIVNVVRGLKGREIIFVIQRCTGSNFYGNFSLLCKRKLFVQERNKCENIMWHECDVDGIL